MTKKSKGRFPHAANAKLFGHGSGWFVSVPSDQAGPDPVFQKAEKAEKAEDAVQCVQVRAERRSHASDLRAAPKSLAGA
ncbi:hypothetical protein J7T55_009327 [Diaporthe amygdali]|uniref:uncharacterized protein n=1 Tax=Phomopsis amygdali TaxID=1214568 RepID=UPI0022FF3AE0|nr:uncharacterized protein J7T55_009327 [Diaporthe amygdali]KAJ0107363.1 hypothetical protein J7T55_009327 [Diaporthe amygdali]